MRRNLAPLFFVLSCTIEPGGQVGPVDLGEPAEQTVTIRGPAAYAAAPNGITLSLLCKSGASISLQGDFEESPRTLGCDRGAATARLVFTGDNGTKLVQVRQRSVEVSRAFLKSSAAPVDQWAPIADTVNLCGTNQIAAHPLDRSNVLIINDFPLRMQYSRDGGTTRAVPTGDPFAQNIVRAWADPYVGGTFYATLFVGPTAEVHDILKTTDGGQSWIKTGRAPLLPGNIPISHDDYANIYDAGRLEIDLKHRLYAGYRQGIAYSDDEGQSWVIKTYPQLTSLLMTHITPSPDAATIWVGTDNLGVFKSSDGGATIAPEPQLSRLNPPYTASTPHRLQAGVWLRLTTLGTLSPRQAGRTGRSCARRTEG